MSTGRSIARGSLTLIDYSDAASISSMIESNKPLTCITVNDQRTNSWSNVAPLILTPVVYISSVGGAENMISHITGGKWEYKQSGGANKEWTVCTNSTSESPTVFTIEADNVLKVKCDGEGVTTNKSLLTSESTTVTFRFTGTYTDNNGMSTSVVAIITFSLIQSGSDKTVTSVYTPDGNIFTKKADGTTPDKTAVLEMWRGSVVDFSDVEFAWYRQDDRVFNPMKIKTTTTIGGTTITIDKSDSDHPYDSHITEGSQFLLTNGTTYTDDTSLGSVVYEVLSADSSNGIITLRQVGTTDTGLSGAFQAGTMIVSRWYDKRVGNGWARIKSTTKDDSVSNGTGGAYLGTMNTSNSTESPVRCTGSNVLVVPADSVDGLETFKGIAYDLDPTTNGNAELGYVAHPQVLNFLDYTDPYQLTVFSNNGTIMRNGKGYIKCETELRQGGDLLAERVKRAFKFSWQLFNSNGTEVNEFYYGNKLDNNKISGLGTDVYHPAHDLVDALDNTTASADIEIHFDTAYIHKSDIQNKCNVVCTLKEV